MSPQGFRIVIEHGTLPPPGGQVKRRLAVRGLIWRPGLLLMVRSSRVGDWKFPGGGCEARETEAEALVREVAEETGYACRVPLVWVGTAVERSAGREVPGSLFEMESRYFRVQVTGRPGPLCLDKYEKDLGLTPGWVAPQEALEVNRRLAASGRPDLPPWLTRETRVLELLASPSPSPLGPA